MSAEFYVYGYFTPEGTPFYVGKGKRNRAFSHLAEAKKTQPRERNKHKLHTIRKCLNRGVGPEIRIIDSGLSEDLAFELEAFLIEEIGRADLGSGPLTNMSNGGEGLTGLVRDLSGPNNPNYGKRGEDSIWWGRKHSEEAKHKISSAQVGRVFTEEHKTNMRKPKSEQGRANIAKAREAMLAAGYRPSEESNKKRSEALKGRPSPMRGQAHSEEAREKMSTAHRGVSKKKTACEYCGKLCAPNVLHRWHMDNCKEKSQ